MEAALRPSCAMTRFGFVSASFVFSLVGTVVSASVKTTGGLSFQEAITLLRVSWGPAFGCSIGAVFLQFIGFILALAGMCVKTTQEVGFDQREGHTTQNFSTV